ncbi:MAG: hypothetical protein ABWZ83_01435, partial [Mesorhizobium sp.]
FGLFGLARNFSRTRCPAGSHETILAFQKRCLLTAGSAKRQRPLMAGWTVKGRVLLRIGKKGAPNSRKEDPSIL